MKTHMIVGNEAIILECGDLLCLKCKHFDIKEYEKDIVINKRDSSYSACKDHGVIWSDGNPWACSKFLNK